MDEKPFCRVVTLSLWEYYMILFVVTTGNTHIEKENIHIKAKKGKEYLSV